MNALNLVKISTYADIIGRSVGTIRNWIKSGKFRNGFEYVTIDGVQFIDMSALDVFIKENPESDDSYLECEERESFGYREKPRIGNDYFFIDDKLDYIYTEWKESEDDISRYNAGNCILYLGEAKAMSEKLKEMFNSRTFPIIDNAK